MGRFTGIASAIVGASLLASCGVPRLYAPPKIAARSDTPAPTDPKANLAPKVADIVDEIACELGGAGARQLGGSPYTVQVLLNLEVDDNLDLTPSISLINPLTGASQIETNTLSADVGGARIRTFTATYYLDSAKLPTSCGNGRDQAKLYRLDGRLDLFEIARDGAGVIAKAQDVRPADAKLIPTFGSTVQFTVTRQVTALGPLWTLKRFKGPSDKNGLINGKRVSIDKAVFVFTPQAPPALTQRQKAAADLVAIKSASLASAESRSAAAADRANATTVTRSNLEAQLQQTRSRDRIATFQLNRSIAAAATEERRARADLAARTADERQRNAELDAALAEKRDADAAVANQTDAARLAGQTLLTSILLQNATLLNR